MVEDPWASFPNLPTQGSRSENFTSTGTNKATTELSQHQVHGESGTCSTPDCDMKAHPDRQQIINEYEASGAAPRKSESGSRLNESSITCDATGSETPVILAAEQTSRLASKQVSEQSKAVS